MREIQKENFIKNVKNGKKYNTFKFREEGYTYTQGVYLFNKNNNIYGFVNISFKELGELIKNN